MIVPMTLSLALSDPSLALLLAEGEPVGSDAASRSSIITLFWIAAVAALTPLLSRLTRGFVPDPVLLLIFGMILGPHVLGWAAAGDVEILTQLGLGMLFLLAGYELDPRLLGGRPGRVAVATWVVSLLLAWGAVTVIVAGEGFTAHMAIAIAITSTALGTLLPILKQAGVMGTALGRSVLAHGAVGELGPIFAMSLLLTSRGFGTAAVVLALFAVAAVLIAVIPGQIFARLPLTRAALTALSDGPTQMPIRVVFWLLVTLMAVAAVFDLDVVLGAFAAGIILRRLLGGERPELGAKLEVIGFGVLIPIFFVTSGMQIDIRAVAANPALWAGLVFAIALARGLPVWVSEQFVPHGANLGDATARIQLGLYAATGLPIIVAVTQVAVDAELMGTALASTLVAAGATTVLLFPLLARAVGMIAARSGSGGYGSGRSGSGREKGRG